MTQSPVVIAGAGIAGLTAAIAFARQGLPVQLIERRTGFEEVGAGIQLSPNASRLLLDLGVSALLKSSVALEQLDIRDWNQPRSFAHMPMTEPSHRYGAPFLSFRRADLQMALLDTARAMSGITILVDRAITGFNATAEGVSVKITRGNGHDETIEARFLVAADGLWSCLRHAAGNIEPPRFTGYEAWRTLIPATSAPAFIRQPRVGLWMGPKHHAVHYPVEAGKQINLVIVRKATEAPAPHEEWSLPPTQGEVETLSHDAAVPLKHLISAAPSWRRWPMFDSLPVIMGAPHLADGRLALIGDAAHPVLPFLAQGAALGIEDAVELALALAPALINGDKAQRHAAITSFNAVRHPRAARLQKAARRNGMSYHLGKPWSLARDMVIRRLGPEGMLARHDWIYSWKPSGQPLTI